MLLRLGVLIIYLICNQLVPAKALASEPISLDTLFNMVRQINPAITTSRLEILEKQELAGSARKNLYPSLLSQYTYLKQYDLPFEFGGVSFSLENTYNYSVSVEQPLYAGKSLVTADKLSRLELSIARQSLKQTKNSVYLQVSQAFFGFLKAQGLQTVAEQSVLALESHLKDTKAFFSAGFIPKNDVLAGEVQLAQERQDYLAAQHSTLMGRSILNILLKRPADHELVLDDTLDISTNTPDWKAALDLALANRPEIKQYRIRLQQAEENITLAKSPYLPSVTLSATYLKQGDDPFATSYPLGASEVKSAQAVAQWKFWSWGQRCNQTEAAMRRQAMAQEALSGLQDSIILEVREAYLSLIQAKSNINVAAKAEEQAEENFRINKARYQAHLATSTEVLDAETLLSKSRTNHINARYDYSLAVITLNWSTGIGPEGVKNEK